MLPRKWMEAYLRFLLRHRWPVIAISIGIGIDYGYYVLSRITEEYEHFLDFDRAIEEALMTTGRAILFTGTTLTASVIF